MDAMLSWAASALFVGIGHIPVPTGQCRCPPCSSVRTTYFGHAKSHHFFISGGSVNDGYTICYCFIVPRGILLVLFKHVSLNNKLCENGCDAMAAAKWGFI